MHVCGSTSAAAGQIRVPCGEAHSASRFWRAFGIQAIPQLKLERHAFPKQYLHALRNIARRRERNPDNAEVLAAAEAAE